MILSELKTKYPSLDEGNISSFIGDIRRAVEGDEISNTDVRNYLDSLVDGFEPEGQRICALREPSAPDKAALTVAGRVLAAEMLLLRKMNSLGALRHRSLMFLQYCAALSRTNYPFVETMLAVACYQIDSPGFHWNDIQIALSLDQLAYRFIHDGHIIKDKSESWLLRGRGSVSLKDGRLTLSSFAGTEAGAEAFKTGGDRVSVVSRNVRDEKLKSSESNDAEAVARFAKSFLSELDRSPVSRAARPAPVAGDEVDIVCVGQNDDARLVFRILDDDHPFEGVLEEEELVVGLKTSELEDFIFQDDCIKGAVLLGDGPEHSFSIRSAYQEFAVSAAKDAYHAGTCFEARVSHLRNDIKCLNWISALGFGGVSNLPEGSSLKEGDVRVLEMKMLPNTGKSVYINVRTPRAAVDKIVRLDEDEVLRGFVRTQAAILASQEEERKQDAAKDVTPKVLGRIASALASRAPLQPPMDRYRMLLSAQFLFRILDDGDRVRALQTEASWLQRCLCFAQNGTVGSGDCSDLPVDQQAVISLLAAFSGNREPDSVALAGEIGALVSAYCISRRFPDEFRADPDTVRRKICSLLNVEGEFRPAGNRRIGKYGSVERQDLEFKSSYVMRNDGSGADLDYQGRGQVFEAVCGFLNANGGEVYLGVNDAGDPLTGDGYGLKGDMDWLCANYASVNRLRREQLGHSVTKADSLDHFVLFLNSEKELYFKETLLNLITIEPTEDADAIRISVRPSKYELAYMYSNKSRTDGVAYVRDGGSTRRMTDHQKRLRLLSLKSIDKEAGFVVTIQEAIDQHRKLIFKGYTSGNSGKVADRFVVPVNLLYNDENVYCWDLVAGKFKQFRLHRISSIEPYGDDPYTLPADAVRKDVDVFRWVDGKSYHVKVRMDAIARNCLLEEYSKARYLPPEEFYQESEDKWILDTQLHGTDAIRRFYLGLADKMEILDTEDAPIVRREITRFVNEYLLTPKSV